MCINGKLGIAGIVTGILAIGYTTFVQTRVIKTRRLIESTIDGIAKDITVDISNEIVSRAIEKAANRKIDKAINSASEETIDGIRKDMQRRVGAEVNRTYSDIKESVSNELAKQVADLDMRKLKAEVVEKAKQLVVERFDGTLDSLLNDFNQNLANVSKIYSSIADSVTKKKDSGMVFRLE